MANRWLWKEFYENFSFKNYLPLKTSNVKGSNRHLRPTQTSLQSRDHCRQILSTQHCRPRARELPRSCQLFVWRTVSELWDVKYNFRILAYFLHIKRLKVPPGDQPTAQGLDYNAECLRLFGIVVQYPKRCLLLVGFSCEFCRGAGIPKLDQILLTGNACTQIQCYYIAHLIWSKDGSKPVHQARIMVGLGPKHRMTVVRRPLRLSPVTTPQKYCIQKSSTLNSWR